MKSWGAIEMGKKKLQSNEINHRRKKKEGIIVFRGDFNARTARGRGRKLRDKENEKKATNDQYKDKELKITTLRLVERKRYVHHKYEQSIADYTVTNDKAQYAIIEIRLGLK